MMSKELNRLLYLFASLLFKTPLELIAVVCLLLYLIGWQPLMGVLFILMLIPVPYDHLILLC